MKLPFTQHRLTLPASDRMHYSYTPCAPKRSRRKEQRIQPPKSLTSRIPIAESSTRAVTPARGVIARLGAAAIDPSDSDDVKLRKTLLMFASGLMNLAAILWLLIYWSMGLKLPTSIPLGFQIASAAILVIYLRTRNFDFFRVAQLSLFLFFPFVIQWSIGSFVSSSGIALLALLAPVGAMICYGPRESIPWFIAFIVLTSCRAYSISISPRDRNPAFR